MTHAGSTSPLMGAALALALALDLLAGCASAPPERFYTLSAGARAMAPSPAEPARSVVVTPAALPEIVDRPQLVMRAGANQVAILEQQRWGEPLRTGISRVVAEDLARLLGTWRVSTREEAIRSPDCRVYLDVRRFESRAGAAANLEALWTVACAGTARKMGRSVVEEPIDGPAFESVVTAQGRALDAVSRDIAQALRETAPVAVSQGPEWR